MTARQTIGATVGALALSASLLGIQTGGASAHTRPYDSTSSRYGFQLIASPHDPTFTQLLGINDHGTIAGYDGSGQTVDGTLHPNKGFTLTLPASFTPRTTRTRRRRRSSGSTTAATPTASTSTGPGPRTASLTATEPLPPSICLERPSTNSWG